MNKTNITCIAFFKKLIIVLNLHCPFETTESIACIFFIFWPSKIRVSPTDVVFSLSPLRCRLSPGQHHHAAASCHAFFALNQDELVASASSFDNASSHHLPSRTKIKALNLHHHNSTTTICHPLRTTRLSFSIVIKGLSQSGSLFPLLNHVSVLLPH
jgi:hypothetical protein